MKTHIQSQNLSADSSAGAKAGNQANHDSILQAYKEGTAQLAAPEEEPVQPKENKTGLPDGLKSGVENLSGHSLDDVQVHYNSSEPASLQAHAYAQGTDIHVAPGQEKHLPHEAWHVVQQKQGRVKPTKQLKGTTRINDDAGLEKEADVMGAKAMQLKTTESNSSLQLKAVANHTAQLTTSITHDTDQYSYRDNRDGQRKTQNVGVGMCAFLDPEDAIRGSATGGPQQEFITEIRKTFKNDNMIRGHLLNHDLGGFGVEANLFPITSSANGVHLRTVEYGVKKALADSKNDDGKGVYYEVNVTGSKDDNSDAPVSAFECRAHEWNDVEDQGKIGDEILRVNVVSSPKKSGPKRAAGLRGSANDGALGPVANFKHSSGLATWNHQSRSGKQNFQDLINNGKIFSMPASDEAPVDSVATGLLFLDEHGETINDIFDLLLESTQKDDIEDLVQEDYDTLVGDDKTLFDKYLEIINWLEERGIDPGE